MIPATPRSWVKFQGNAKPVYLECKCLPNAYCKCLTNDVGLKLTCMHIEKNIYCLRLGSVRFKKKNVFERILLCSPTLHLFNQKYTKNSNILKYYNLK